jgi:hypothetical protein
MALVRVFNPSAYTPRAYFAGEKGATTTMARHRAKHHRRRHHHHAYRHNPMHRRRHNPFGLSGGVVRDASFNAVGALGSLMLSGVFGQSGWMDVGATLGSAVAVSFAGKMVGGAGSSEELLKGGLTATIIKAIHQAGFAKNLGLGLYAPSWFGVPTASSQYMRAYNANLGPAPRGQGTIYISSGGGLIPAAVVPGPGGVPTAVPAGAPMLPPAGGTGMGYHRFRSRYAGGY